MFGIFCSTCHGLKEVGDLVNSVFNLIGEFNSLVLFVVSLLKSFNTVIMII